MSNQEYAKLTATNVAGRKTMVRIATDFIWLPSFLVALAI
jgi:hypothetical protein